MPELYDLIIVGGSAAATTAGIYAARRNLKFKIVSKDFGGEVATSGEIGNWPGQISTDGIKLTEQFKEHLKSYGADIEEYVEVKKIVKTPDGNFCITVKKDGEKMASDKLEEDGNGELKCDYMAKSVIVATGVHPRELSVPGEKEFRNKGVSYCTTCDGPIFAGKTVATIGGGNSALESGLMLADIAKKVYVINKNPVFKGDQVLIDNLHKKSNVEIIYSALTTEINGEKFVTGLKFKNKDGEIKELKVDGVFVHIGHIPNSGIVPVETEKDQFGNIVISQKAETNISGLFAAGDVTNIPYKQIVVAAGQGSVAALSVVEYLNRLSK